jgi:hypothetical protein
MSGPEMNAPIRKKMAVPLLAFCAAPLTACVGAFDPGADATSPVAPRVEALVEANRHYPSWADFPKAEAAPEPTQIAAQVNTLKATGGALAGEVSRIEWTLTDDPAAFAAAVRARVDAVEVAPVTADTQAELAAFLAAARERGRAPPPVDRR